MPRLRVTEFLSKFRSSLLVLATCAVVCGDARAQAAEDPLALLMQLSPETATVESTSPRTYAELAARCAEQMGAAQSYRSWLIQRDFSMDYLKPRNFAYVEWRFDFAAPGRFRVSQTIHEKAPLGEMRDERVTIEQEHYVHGGTWMRAAKEMAGDYAELNRFLGLAKFADILRTGRPSGAGTATVGGRSLAVIEYDNVKLEGYQILAVFDGVRGRARLWIDAETAQLVKGELIYRGKDSSDRAVNKVFEQVFDYGGQVSIEVPKVK
jgi:hypothetical protein